MRLLLLFLALSFVAIQITIAAAAEPRSYPVFVHQDGAVARSGPGEHFYVTERLGRSIKLEVYAEEPGGWLAVRPPAGSFSWMAAGDLETTPDPTLGKAAYEGVAAWVGSSSERIVEHRAQVRLEHGEVVELLGQRQFCPPGAKCQLWYKIAPPAGEFRYVHSQFVSREPLLESTDDPGQVPIDIVGFSQGTSAVAQNANDPESLTNRASAATTEDERAEQVRIPEAALAGFTEPAASSASAAQATDEDFLAEVDRVDFQLSQMVAQDVQDWDLKKLATAAQALIDSGQSAPQRGRARLLLERVQEFEEWQKRFQESGQDVRQAINELSDSANPIDSGETIGTGVESASHAGTGSELADFDGTGWLMPVHSDKPGAPPFALVDQEGNVLQFVSPAAGFNLRRYIEKEVGIIGKRGFASQMNKPHLTAYRVVELDRHR